MQDQSKGASILHPRGFRGRLLHGGGAEGSSETMSALGMFPHPIRHSLKVGQSPKSIPIWQITSESEWLQHPIDPLRAEVQANRVEQRHAGGSPSPRAGAAGGRVVSLAQGWGRGRRVWIETVLPSTSSANSLGEDRNPPLTSWEAKGIPGKVSGYTSRMNPFNSIRSPSS